MFSLSPLSRVRLMGIPPVFAVLGLVVTTKASCTADPTSGMVSPYSKYVRGPAMEISVLGLCAELHIVSTGRGAHDILTIWLSSRWNPYRYLYCNLDRRLGITRNVTGNTSVLHRVYRTFIPDLRAKILGGNFTFFFINQRYGYFSKVAGRRTGTHSATLRAYVGKHFHYFWFREQQFFHFSYRLVGLIERRLGRCFQLNGELSSIAIACKCSTNKTRRQ